MRAFRWVLAGGVIVAASMMVSRAQAPAAVTVTVQKYQDLCDLVTANKGNVVVLDFWALTCVPCKQAFPHTVALQKALASQGLVVISVSTDPLKAETADNTKRLVLTFLKKNEAAFTNIILDEPLDVLTKKLRVSSLPCIYVFNREGKWRQFVDEELASQRDPNFRYPGVEAYIMECLKQPAPK
jgi:thiol-disulfide isomerase/thioredoxin